MRTRRWTSFFVAFAVVVSACSSGAGGEGSTTTGQTTSTPSDEGTTSTGGDSLEDIELTFFYPVLVPGPITETFDTFIEEFQELHPNITINSEYSGSYDETTERIQTLLRGGGDLPDVAIIGNQHTVMYADMDAIVPLDNFIEGSDDPTFIDDFFPGFMENVLYDGQTWSIPFQRSTPVMYWNKRMFEEAGLDPDAGPQDYAELREAAQALTGDGVWGVQIPSDIDAWVVQALTVGNGTPWSTDDPSEVSFDSPAFIETLDLFLGLANEDQVMPSGVLPWAEQPTDFVSENVGIIFHTTGSLTSVLAQSEGRFDVGVGFLPAGSSDYGVITGGGNFAIFKDSSPEEQNAAWEFIEFMSQPDQMARWNIATGYVAPRQAAWDTDAMANYIEEVPQVEVARDQLEYAAKQMMTHELLAVTRGITQEIQAVLSGNKSPEEAAAAAQAAADEILTDFR
jgi:sn-glycerol 3-phosphate transport system substrate-binding protein